MKEKFKIKKIYKNIYLIEEKWFEEHANLYLVKDKNFNLLIDCGLGIYNLKKFLNNKGFKKIKAVLTHSHFDHAFGLKHFTPEEVFITNKMRDNLNKKELLGLEYFDQHDLDASTTLKAKDSLLGNIFSKNYKKVGIGLANFKIIKTPGHTDDSVIYYDKKQKIIITGDTLYDGKIYNNFINSNNKKFKKTLQNIAKLDFKLVLPGHGKIMNKKEALKVLNKWETGL